MNFYDMFMYPIEKNILSSVRKDLVSEAEGKVLEIGVGTGVNFKYYNRNKVKGLTAMDISIPDSISEKYKSIRWVEARAEKIPFKDETFDTVVVSLLLCSVENLDKSILEIKRVLKSGGKFLFVEHVLPENANENHFFHKVNPVWSRMASGCNINRETDKIILNSGFKVSWIKKRGKTIFCYGVAIK